MLKIMIAVDGSPASLQAVRHGMRLVEEGLSAHFVIANVQKEASLLELVTQDSDMIAAACVEAGTDLVAPAVALLAAAGISHEVDISLGEPSTALVDVAENHECEQIIIGVTGLGETRSYWIGSVSREVAKLSSIPVTIVRTPEQAAAEDAGEGDAQADEEASSLD